MSGSPSERIFAEARAVTVVKDVQGRALEVRRPGALDRLRLFKALGPSLSRNDRYLGYAMLAMCVACIGETPVPQPGNEAQLEALIERLGDAGLVAVGQALDALGFDVETLEVGSVMESGRGNGEARPG